MHWNKTYYIVVYQEGGNEFNYYKWYYGTGNPYENGSFYMEENYNWQWQEDANKDFCFRTYAYASGEEPDGVVERWAVLLGCKSSIEGVYYYADKDAYDWKECLIRHGWDESHIKMLISPTFDQVESAMEWLASVDDGDDLDLITWSSHGGEVSGDYGFAVADIYVHGKDINAWLDECSAKGFCLIACTCYAEHAIYHLKREGRVILAESAADKKGSCSGYTKMMFLHIS